MPERQAAAPPAAAATDPLVDPIARHCRNSGHIRPGLCKAHFNAFMPKLQESSAQLEVSVFHASGQTPAALEHIGRTVVKEPLKGHVLVPLAAIVARNLSVVPAPEPHFLHANILGWSDDKGVQRLDAKALADASSQLTMYADPA